VPLDIRPADSTDWVYLVGSALTVSFAGGVAVRHARRGATLEALIMAAFVIVFGADLGHLYVWSKRRRDRYSEGER